NPTPLHFRPAAPSSTNYHFLFNPLHYEIVANLHAVSVSWPYAPKSQPPGATFKVPPVDAPNVNGARIFGFASGKVGDEVKSADVARLKKAIDAGGVTALYVFDPGPDGSLGDTQWIDDARTHGRLP